MDEPGTMETPNRGRIGRVLVGPKHSAPNAGHDPFNQLRDRTRGRSRRRPPVAGLESRPVAALSRAHHAAAAELRLVKAVDVVGGAHQELGIEGPVVTGLERPKSVEDEARLGVPGTVAFVKEQALTTEPPGLTHHGGVGHAKLAGDLAKPSAGGEAEEKAAVEVAPAKPVGRMESL